MILATSVWVAATSAQEEIASLEGDEHSRTTAMVMMTTSFSVKYTRSIIHTVDLFHLSFGQQEIIFQL